MCLHPQFVQRIDAINLFWRGFTFLYSKHLGKVLSNRDFVENEKGQYFLKIRTRKCFTRHDDPEVHVYSKYEREKPSLYYAEYYFSDEDMREISLLNPETGQLQPLYVECPCGHCEVCNAGRINRIADRCVLQSCSHGQPFFVTLTIRESDYSCFKTREDSVEYLQKYHKLLRKFLSEYDPNLKLSYVLCSEYGAKSHRLHFHAVYWVSSSYEYLHSYREFIDFDENGVGHEFVAPQFHKFLRRAWKFGNIYVENSKDPSGKYTLKYVGKQIADTDQHIKLQSKKLGYDTLQEHLSYIADNPRFTKFAVYCPPAEKYFDIPISGFVTRIAYPSFARSLPKPLRDDIQKLLFYLCKHTGEWYQYVLKCFQNRFEKYNFEDFDPYDFSKIIDTYVPDNTGGDVTHIQILRHRISNALLQYDLDKVFESHCKHLEHLHFMKAEFASLDVTHYVQYLRRNSQRLVELQTDCQ